MISLIAQISQTPDIGELGKYRWVYSVDIEHVQPTSNYRQSGKIEFSLSSSGLHDWPLKITAQRVYSAGEEKGKGFLLLFEQKTWLADLVFDPLGQASSTYAKPVTPHEKVIVRIPTEAVFEVLSRKTTGYRQGLVRDWMSAKFSVDQFEYVLTVDRLTAPDGMPLTGDISISSSGVPQVHIHLTRLSRRAKNSRSTP